MLRIALLMTCGSWGLRRSLRFVGGRADALPAPVADALVLLFRTFRPRLERVPVRSDAELRALTMPVQVIVGADDVLLDSRETCSRVRRLVPHASVTCIEGAGHILPAQTDAIAAFLDRVAETPVEPMRIG